MVSDSVRLGRWRHCGRVRVPGAAYTALCAPGQHPPARAFLDWLARRFEA